LYFIRAIGIEGNDNELFVMVEKGENQTQWGVDTVKKLIFEECFIFFLISGLDYN
jgi:hypothetical protein